MPEDSRDLFSRDLCLWGEFEILGRPSVVIRIAPKPPEIKGEVGATARSIPCNRVCVHVLFGSNFPARLQRFSHVLFTCRSHGPRFELPRFVAAESQDGGVTCATRGLQASRLRWGEGLTGAHSVLGLRLH